MLKQRIITAVLLLPLLVGIFFYLSLDYFATAIIITVFMMAQEWARLVGLKKLIYTYSFAFVVTALNLLIWSLADNLVVWPSPSWPSEIVWDIPLVVLTFGLFAVFIASLIVFTYSRLPKWWANGIVIAILGLILLPTFFVTLASIRNAGYMADYFRGGELLLLMFCLIWAADTGAYFVGKAFGRRKMAPNVSPNKTWEGFLGGISLSFVVAWIGASIIHLEITDYFVFTLVVLLLAVFSVIGDLFESALKRVNNIKDSGKLLPGHGGLLDRLDSTLVVAPLYFLSFSYLGWF